MEINISKIFKMNELVGKTINDWYIIEARPERKKGFVKARCVCGKIKNVRGRTIKSGTSKNCGCKKGEKMKGVKRVTHNTALHNLYVNYKGKAFRTNKEFELTVDEFEILTSSNCYYCGASPKNVYKHSLSNYVYNGVDRVDNTLGYIKSNVVSC